MQAPTDQELPFSAACERNKQPITAVLRGYLPASGAVLEIGSGTGQHVVHFAREFPGLSWQPTDTGHYLTGLRARLAAEAPANVRPALELDVRMQPWPVGRYPVVFSANTLHFMSMECDRLFFAGVAAALLPAALLLVYGPFRYAGAFTSASDADFDRWLREGDPDRGVRDCEWVNELAAEQGLQLLDDHAMPANNRLLVWRAAA